MIGRRVDLGRQHYGTQPLGVFRAGGSRRQVRAIFPAPTVSARSHGRPGLVAVAAAMRSGGSLCCNRSRDAGGRGPSPVQGRSQTKKSGMPVRALRARQEWSHSPGCRRIIVHVCKQFRGRRLTRAKLHPPREPCKQARAPLDGILEEDRNPAFWAVAALAELMLDADPVPQ